MKEPTNQMLIDALCIAHADRGLYRGTLDRAIVKRAFEIIENYAPMAVARIQREQEQASEPDETPSPEDTPNGREIVRRHADVDSPELTDEQLSNLRPARGPGEPRLIEADEIVVTTRDVECAVECQRSCGNQRPVHFNGLDFRVIEYAQAGFENRWVLKLLRWRQMGATRRLYPAADVRVGTTETFIYVTNTNGSGFRVEFKPSQYVAGVMLGEAHVKFVEIKGDPHHGLTDEQWAFFQTLQEAFTAGQTLTFDFGGKTYTGVRIASLTKEA